MKTIKVTCSFLLLLCSAQAQAQIDEDAPENPADFEERVIDAEEGTGEDADNTEAPAEEPQTEAKAKERATLGTTIFGSAKKRKRIAGSADVVTEKELERYEQNSVEKVLEGTPGVYARTEDGSGLRPNIGLRGASSDRSSKVTLMEDGVLFGPAPYAAPAAYYFPLVTRMRRLELFKGPGAVRFGPSTVGGALNLMTRSVPYAPAAFLDVSAGNFKTLKGHAGVGASSDVGSMRLGFVLEGARVQSDGFKTLESGDPTGFTRNDLMAKVRLSSQEDAANYHAFEAKVGYGDELSNETYLGLTDADFAQNPYARYAASGLGRMNWSRTQAQLRYTFESESGLQAQVTAYRHDMDRSWRKFNRFLGGPDPALLLKNPDAGANAIFVELLRGNRDSQGIDETLQIGTNRRVYFSQGVQAGLSYDASLLGMTHSLEVGARVHQDQIERIHTEESHLMLNGTLVRDGTDTTSVTENQGRASAIALHLSDEIEWGPLLLVPGVRTEFIHTQFENFKDDESSEANQMAIMPGIGASYSFNDQWSVLAGVHRGFSPVSPGQSDDVLPEQSINVELGLRGGFGKSDFEVTGFGNRYTNLTGECTFSAGCSDDILGTQFNGGEVLVYGAEARLRQHIPLRWQAQMLLDLSYTFTQSQFQNAFISPNPQFGDVEVGDSLAYVPAHRGALRFLYAQDVYEFASSFSFASAMRDEAGQGIIEKGNGSNGYFLLDVATHYQLFEKTRLYFTIENVLNQTYIASRRPFGARPGKPTTINLGLKHRF